MNSTVKAILSACMIIGFSGPLLFAQSVGKDTVEVVGLNFAHNRELVTALWMFEDSSRSMALADAASPRYAYRYRHTNTLRGLFQDQDIVAWGRVILENRTTSDFTGYLFLAKDTVVMHTVHEDGRVVTQLAGNEVQVPDRSNHSPSHAYRVSVPAGQRVRVYMRIVNDGWQATICLPVLWRAGDYEEQRIGAGIFQGSYLGLVLAMICYFFAVYVTTKDRAFFWGIPMGVSFALYFLQLKGLAADYLWPQYPLFWLEKYGVAAIISPVLIVSSHLFVCALLELRDSYRKLFLLSMVLALLGAGFDPACSALKFSFVGLTAGSTFQALWLLSLLVMIVGKVLRRDRAATVMLFSSLVVLAGGMIQSWTRSGFIQRNVVTENMLQVGSAILFLMMSLALAYKLSQLRRQKETAQAELLAATMDQNLLLEQRVEERTAELRNTQQQLVQQEKLASLGQLTAGIAHEIRNPLNFVMNFSESARELLDELKHARDDTRGEIIEELDRTLEKIGEHGKRADGIVGNMMLHARKGGGEREATDINALLSEAITLASHASTMEDGSAGIEISEQFDASLPAVTVVPQDMSRVFLNIATNALDAMREKLLASSGEYTPQLRASTSRKDENVEIRIADNGPGVPPEISEKIFLPFFTTKPPGQGTGLGLSMSHDVVRAHGGSLSVSGDGSGTVFIILLPLRST